MLKYNLKSTEGNSNSRFAFKAGIMYYKYIFKLFICNLPCTLTMHPENMPTFPQFIFTFPPSLKDSINSSFLDFSPTTLKLLSS